MKREWIRYAAAAFAASALLAGCANIRKLSKENPEVAVNLPARSSEQAFVPPCDTVSSQKIITFRKEDGTELYFTPMAVDTLTGEKLMSVAIDEVVISASNRRNLVERNGKINVEFIVMVPEEFQYRNWRLTLVPQLGKGPDTVSLDPLVYTGEGFRAMQEREYDRYADYRSRIVDSADYFDRFGDRRRYDRYMSGVAQQRTKYASMARRLEGLTPAEAMFDEEAGWTTLRERRRQYARLRGYVRATDRRLAGYVTYTPDTTSGLDHLNDFLAPRYRYGTVDVLPGGEIYTRVDGKYPDGPDNRREGYLHRLAEDRYGMIRDVDFADERKLRRLAGERLEYTGNDRKRVEALLAATSDSTTAARYRMQQARAAGELERLAALDTAEVRRSVLDRDRIARNRELDARSGEVFARTVHYPYLPNARLDTVIRRPDGRVEYHYTEQVEADENTSKLYLYLKGRVEDRGGRSYRLRRSDTLTYNVASMTTFLDERTRYMQRIITRDAEANARFFFTFPVGKTALVDTLPENRRQIRAVRELTRGLMTDPVYIIDSITLRATSSPEGAWALNERLAKGRAEALRDVLVSEFRVLYDSLKVSANYTLDSSGRVVAAEVEEGLPDLPNLLRTKWLAEDWDELVRLVAADTAITEKEGLLAMMRREGDPDAREWRIRLKYPKAYERMKRVLYPQMRAVDFRFNLHRRGMRKDTVYTTEVDSAYMHAVELLKKRRYEEALPILRPYEDRNTALAYMSLGYDAAAYRILRSDAQADRTADIQYMLAILAARLGDEERAVQYYLRAVELRANLKFRGNLDPEIARLIRKYGLFREDFR